MAKNFLMTSGGRLEISLRTLFIGQFFRAARLVSILRQRIASTWFAVVPTLRSAEVGLSLVEALTCL